MQATLDQTFAALADPALLGAAAPVAMARSVVAAPVWLSAAVHESALLQSRPGFLSSDARPTRRPPLRHGGQMGQRPGARRMFQSRRAGSGWYLRLPGGAREVAAGRLCKRESRNAVGSCLVSFAVTN